MGKGGGGGDQITGYRYSMAVHMGLCRGPIDELVQIKVDNLVAWTGSIVDDTDTAAIDAPRLFGGDDKEGGIAGGFSVLMGKKTQDIAARSVPNLFSGDSLFGSSFGLEPSFISGASSIKELYGGFVSSFRGFVSLFYRGQISANNPYPKSWKMRVRRTNAGWHNDTPWYPEKAAIWLAGGQIRAMNAAHIIFECLTNPAWGRGLPWSQLDDAAFTSAANTLCDEGLGLCIRWSRNGETVEDFISKILDHIGAALYTDRGTGLLVLRLIRDDYDPATIPVFDVESGLLEIVEDDSSAGDTQYNEVVVGYSDPVLDDDGQVRAQNLAAFQATQSVLGTRVDYPGVPTSGLAQRLAQRDLRMHSAGLKRFKLKLDRRGWKVAPASVLRVVDVARGLDTVLRVGRYEDSTHTDGTITVTAVQDVFGLPLTTFITPQSGLWEPPNRTAIIPDNRRLVEASFRDVVVRQGLDFTLALAADAAAVGILIQQPTPLSMNYLIGSRVSPEEFAPHGVGPWTPTGTVAAATGTYDTAIVVTDISRPGSLSKGMVGLIGDEVIRLDDFDLATGAFTIARGCGDTIPAAHAAGSLLWFYGPAYSGTDGVEYVSSETVDVKVLTRTSTDTLAADVAPTDTITVDQRVYRPYPPGDVRVNGAPFATPSLRATGDIVVTWTHRDRITEQDQLVEHGAASIGPEAGTTYRVRVFDNATLLRTEAGISGTSWTYDAAMSAADGNAGVLRFELETVRDGLASYQLYTFIVSRAGFDQAFDRAFNGGF